MKRNLFSKTFLSIIFAISLTAFFSCTIGMGESVDLEAPVLTITSPANGAFLPRSFTVSGTATDNRKVEKILVTYKYKKDGEEFKEEKIASLTGTDWTIDFAFDGDYEVEIEAFAYDAMQNGSDDSHQRIMVLIDSQNPSVGQMSITRGKYISKLLPLEKFIDEETGKTNARNKSENKDYFQNESFVLSTNLKDNYGIEDVYMELCEVVVTADEETGKKTITEKSILNNIKPISTDNLYLPSFAITEQMLVEADAALATGLHYLKPYVYGKDVASNELDKREYGVLAWEPEYNTPHVSTNTKTDDGSIKVAQGEPVIISIFDDDDLKSYSYAVVKSKSFIASNISNYIPAKQTEITSGLRDTSFEVKTDSTDKDSDGNSLNSGAYQLVIRVDDVSGRSDGVYINTVELRITNADAPTVAIDEPKANSVPELVNNKFTIKGTVVDNEPNNKIAMAWIGPENDATQTAAKIKAVEEFFEETYTFEANDETSISGGKVYLLSSTHTESDRTHTYKFSKEFDFFNDFKVNGKTDNTNKVFVFAAKDPTGNVTTEIFRLSKFSSKPSFEVSYKYKNDSEWIIKDNPVITLEPLKDGQESVSFRVKPLTKNNMPITSCTVTADKGTTDYGTITNWNGSTNEYCTFTIAKAEATSGKIMNFQIQAVDAVGGESKQKLTIQFNEIGSLDSIECNSNENYIFVKGETIELQANFSNTVSVYIKDGVGTPYIPLTGKKRSSETPYVFGRAELNKEKGTESNTLYFKYEVKDEIEISDITIPIDNPINWNGADFTGNIGSFTTTVNGNKYSIDSIKPHIVKYTPKNDGVIESEVDADGTRHVDITFEFNEPVWVESGTIVMQRTAGWYIPPVLSEDVFVKIWNAAEKADRVTLCGSDKEAKTEKGYDEENKVDTMIPAGPYMQYTNGLVVGKGYSDVPVNGEIVRDDKERMIPDIKTKYVLAYKYDIGDTEVGKIVDNLRKVLEKHNYHKAEFDATVVKGSGTNKITLTVSDSNFIDRLVNGVEYYLTLTPNSFHDSAYNYEEKGLAENEYKFWVGPTATPIIRVNRTATNSTTDNPLAATTGDAKTTFKIDCETPDAHIYWEKSETSKEGKTKTDAGKTPAANTVYHTTLHDIQKDFVILNEDKSNEWAFTFTPEIDNGFITSDKGNFYEIKGSSSDVSIGDGNITHAQKIYIRAKADGHGMSESPYGLEGAFKTVLHYVYTKPADSLKILASQHPEGSSYIAGWPLTQNGDNDAFRDQHQLAYKETTTTGRNKTTYYEFHWVSWQIVSDFTLQTHNTRSFQEPADPTCSYGQYIYGYRKRTYAAYGGNDE